MTDLSSKRPAATIGAKMMYLIRRREDASREELIAHWFANHMPDVIRRQQLQASAGRPAARRYIATLFDPDPTGRSTWDGVAQLWFDEALPQPREAHGTHPADTFQQKAEPYLPWATSEYVVLDGELPVVPLKLNPPFPCTRSGFSKITFLVKAKDGVDYDDLFAHWLDVRAPHVVEAMKETGGFRYLVSQSMDPSSEPYTGMAELYFPDVESSQAFLTLQPSDDLDQYVDSLEIRSSSTEMIGIP